MSKKKNKNVKQKFIPWGRTLTTHDNYLGKQKTSSKKERPVVVVDVNKDNDLAVVPLSSKNGNNRTHMRGYQQGQSYYKHFIEIEDNDGQPIRVNKKFRENHKNMDVPKPIVDEIRNRVLYHSKPAKSNRLKLDKFHKKK